MFKSDYVGFHSFPKNDLLYEGHLPVPQIFAKLNFNFFEIGLFIKKLAIVPKRAGTCTQMSMYP